MLILQVRQCEVALADGRLDEAHGLAVAHAIGRHRRGQRVISRLLGALLARGQQHLHAKQHAAALADCEKAAQLGGNRPDVIALRAAAAEAVAQLNRRQQREAAVLATARQHVNDGRLSLGEQLLAAAPADASPVALLRGDIEQRRRAADDAVRACAQALDRGEVERAAQALLHAGGADPHQEELAELGPRVIAAVGARLNETIDQGRLDEAAELLRHLRVLDPVSPHARRHQAVLDGSVEAWRRIQGGAFGDATVLLSRLLALAPNAAWLTRAAEQSRQADQAVSELKVGPLAWLAPGNRPVTATPPSATRYADQLKPMPQPTSPLPMQFMLQVDGVGAFLVLRQPVVTVGPISSPVAADLAVVAEPTLAPVTIVRSDDDYFLRSSAPTPPPTTTLGRLLASGQRLELSPRCRFTFLLPHAASTSAVLDLSGARLPRADVRRVVLMDQDLVMGPGSGSHVVVPQLARPIVLHLSRGQLACTATDAVTIGGNVIAPGAALPTGERVSVGDASFVITLVDSRGSR